MKNILKTEFTYEKGMNIFMNLSELQLNKKARILKINCKENIKRRLLDLGMVKNTEIKPVFISPSGDPKAFEVRGTLIAIREEDTKKIEILI